METRLTQRFLTLVQIDSPSGEEKEMRDYLSTWLENIGFSIRTDKVGNLYGCVEGGGSTKLLLCAHMDTVNPGMGIKPQVVDGTIKSDGTTILGADNKASVSSIMTAIEEYKLKYKHLPNVEVLFSVKEETGGGVEFFPFEWVKSKYGITFDSAKPLGSITLAAPYIYNFRIRFHGKSAHASRPEKGVNALLTATKFLDKLEVGAFDNHETTINVGRIEGGLGINIIPDEVLIEGEVRSTDHKKFLTRLDNVKKLAENVVKQSKVKVSVQLDGYCPGYRYTKTDPFVLRMKKILNESGFKVSYDSSTGVSDVNSLAGAGIKAICLSDGVKDPHSRKERISVLDLEKLKRLVLETIEEFCNV